VSDEGLCILLGHEEDSILLEVDGAIAGHHFSIVLERSDLDFRVFGRNQILHIIISDVVHNYQSITSVMDLQSASVM